MGESLALCRAASKSRVLHAAACITVMFALGGCGMTGEFWTTDAGAAGAAAMPIPAVATRGSPVPPPAAQVLESAPAGARLDYQSPNGGAAVLVLGATYQSGLQLPCRIGRSGIGGGRGAAPGTYVFCRQDNRWYAMPPVVVSGL